MDQVGVEVDEVERVLPFVDFAHHREMRGEIGFEARRIEPNRLIADGHKFRAGFGIGAGKQGHLVAKLDQSFGEEEDDALGATIELGRNRLVQRRNLRDLHLLSWPEQPGRTAKRAYNDEEACWFGQ